MRHPWTVEQLGTNTAAMLAKVASARTTAAQWQSALERADRGLGLSGVTVDAAGHVLLPAGTRAELLA
ncbi:MAG: hypothetical protein ACXVFH_18785 [Solirubrobacteraceae bacterium]